MTEFLLMEMQSFGDMHVKSTPWPRHTVLTKPMTAGDFEMNAEVIGPLWRGLGAFLKKHQIGYTLRQDSTVRKDHMWVRVFLTIPKDGEAVFFKMHWSDQLSLFG